MGRDDLNITDGMVAVMGWSPHHSPTNTSKIVAILLLYKEKEKKIKINK